MSNVRDFGATGDGRTDDTEAIRHAIRDGDGTVCFPRGVYRVTGTILVDLEKVGLVSVAGEYGVAKLVMAGAGPVFHFRGTHDKSADPGSFRPQVWQRERMPVVADLEIEGAHEKAAGLLFEGTMQPTLRGVLIREVETACRFSGRCRNVLIDGCHLFHNRGIGIHFDSVNLHQIIISASHISYCRLGGIRVDGESEIRNLQITGCDIEYNNGRSHAGVGTGTEPTAEIFFDARTGSIREGSISGCTIQATDSESGSNIRMIGSETRGRGRAGAWTITGNLITNQRVNVHMTDVDNVTLTGNVFDTGVVRNVLVERCSNLVIGANAFGHNIDDEDRHVHAGVRVSDSKDVVISGNVLRDVTGGEPRVVETELDRQGALELVRCQRVTVTGMQILNAAPNGLFIDDCSDVIVTGCTILEDREQKLMSAAVRWLGNAAGSLISACCIGSGTDGGLIAPDELRREALVDD